MSIFLSISQELPALSWCPRQVLPGLEGPGSAHPRNFCMQLGSWRPNSACLASLASRHMQCVSRSRESLDSPPAETNLQDCWGASLEAGNTSPIVLKEQQSGQWAVCVLSKLEDQLCQICPSAAELLHLATAISNSPPPLLVLKLWVRRKNCTWFAEERGAKPEKNE